VSALDAWNEAAPGRYVALTDSALRLAAALWADARNSGAPTADPRELDADVLIAAQALDTHLPSAAMVIATVNVGHLGRFAPAAAWSSIRP
jgi:predicted nucleic acid-binding protein